MGEVSTKDAFWKGATAAINTIKNNTNVKGNGFFILGNHEWQPGNFDSSGYESVKSNYSTNGNSLVTDKYVFYDFGATKDFGTYNNVTFSTSNIEKLEAFLKDAPTDRPIFILSHFPLHNENNRTMNNKDLVIRKLNKYSSNHTIIFLWGHNHTDAASAEKHYDNFYTDNIDGTSINFTYCSAGCGSGTEYGTGSGAVVSKGLVATIDTDNKKVNLIYYKEDATRVSSISIPIIINGPEPVDTDVELSVSKVTSLQEGIKYLVVDKNNKYALKNNSSTFTTSEILYSDNVVVIDKNDYEKSIWMANRVSTDSTNLGLYNYENGNVKNVLKVKKISDSSYSISTADSSYANKSYLKYESSNGNLRYYESNSTVGYIRYNSSSLFSASSSSSSSNPINLYKINGITVSFDGNGSSGTLSNIEVYAGEKYGTLPTPKKDGYTFDGWYTELNGGTKVTDTTTVTNKSSHTLYAHWIPNTYKVSFNANGGSGTAMSDESFTYGTAKALTANAYTRTGYTFAGWNTKADGTGTSYEDKASVNNLTTTNNATVTLYAKWTANKYTVSFNANGGLGSMTAQTFTYDVAQNLKSNTYTKSGYTFAGWKDSNETSYTDGQSVKNLTSTNNGTVTLYAQWSQVITYSVKFDGNGSTSGSMSNQTLTYGVAKNLTANAYTRTGYTFAGWNTKNDGTGTSYADGESVSNLASTSGATVTLYAKWTANKYIVSFNANGGSGTTMSSQSFTYDVAQNLKNNTYTRTGYTFAGWNTKNDGTGTSYADGESVSNLASTSGATVTLYAKWTPNTYKVVFNSNGGSGSMADESFTYGTSKALTKNSFTRTGYTFAGWATSTTGNVVYTDGQSVSNLTPTSGGTFNLYAKWTANTYTVTFNGNGGTPSKSNMPVTYGSTYGTLATASRTGYTFNGWYTDATGGSQVTSSTTVNITSAQTLYAHWTANTYKVVFNANGGSGTTMTAQSFTYDVAQNLKNNTYTRNSYSFVGWNTKADGSGISYTNGQTVSNLTPTNGATVTLYAQWSKVQTYSVTFNTNGHGTAPSSITGLTSGSKISKPTDPTAAGYTFGGWYKELSCTNAWDFTTSTVTTNITLYAKWTPVTYSITYNLNGGSVTGNPNTYNIETATFTLKNPTRSGYTFTGWSGTGITGTSTSVSVAKGSTGNRTYTANWQVISGDSETITFDSSVSSGTIVYVNGVKTTVNSSHKALVDKADTYVVTSYNIANASNSDIHSQYPSSMNVYFVDSNGNAKLSSNYTDILKYAGTSIRLVSPRGIRFITSVPADKKKTLINSGIDGYKVMEYGSITCWASRLTNGEEPTLKKNDSGEFEAVYGSKAVAYSRANKTDIIYKNTSTISQYSIALTGNFTDEQCKDDFAFRTYMILRPTNATDSSKDVVIYGGTIYRSISYVAYQNRNDFDPGTDAYEYIWKLIKLGYGSKYDDEYKG